MNLKPIVLVVLSLLLTACSSEKNTDTAVSQPTPETAQSSEVTPVTSQPKETIKHLILTLKQGQSLTRLFAKLGFSDADSFYTERLFSPYMKLSALAVGQKIAVAVKADKIVQFTIANQFDSAVQATRTESGWQVKPLNYATETKNIYKSATINHSLYKAAMDKNIPQDIVNQAITAFSHLVDLQRGIHKGDRLEVYYSEKAHLESSSIHKEQKKPEQLLFTKLIVKGEEFTLYRHQQDNLPSSFYFPDGRLAESFLLKTPLNGARLSSTFGKRKHPVLGYSRLHKGLDFGAPVGTPIFAAGNGVIAKAGWGGSFGNRIVIEHLNNYQTLYAHLKGFAKGIKAGTKVKQGQVIGYLGNTGLSQARHLHYEVHKNNKAINPLSLKLSNPQQLAGTELNLFKDTIARISNSISQKQQLYYAEIKEEPINQQSNAE